MDNEIIDAEQSVSETEMPEASENTEEYCEECTETDSECEIEYIAPSLDGDMDELKSAYPDLISTRRNVDSARYADLRALGLTPKEAYLATSEMRKVQDTRMHLVTSMPRAAKSPVTGMSRREMEIARTLFDGISDEEIKRLYSKVKAK